MKWINDCRHRCKLVKTLAEPFAWGERLNHSQMMSASASLRQESHIFNAMGWACVPVCEHPGVYYMTTPFTLRGGRALSFYVSEEETNYQFTDDGDIVWALQTVGHPLEDRRLLRGLRSIGDRAGISLGDDGAFRCTATDGTLADTAAQWLALLADICDWDEERLAIEDMDQTLEAEIEKILIRNSGKKLASRPSYMVGKTTVEFSFRWGDILVDAVPLHAAATNARLRKALVVQRQDDEQSMLFVVDDRGELDRADGEVGILANVTRAVALRNLEHVCLSA